MNNIIQNDAISLDRPVILLAPLDWGLGHSTRCVPLIKHLLSLDYEVIIAGEGPQMALLMQEFPSVKCVYLQGYRLKYADTGRKTIFKLFLQIPKILTAIKKENRWLNDLSKKFAIKAVISDNRYGLYHHSLTSIFITHQLKIKTFPNGLGESFLQKINYYFINKFSECWIPDYNNTPNLAGSLAHPNKRPSVPVKYLGPLSRIHSIKTKEEKTLLIILSGPEPQRTIFENLCIAELKDFQEKVVFIRGLPGNKTMLKDFNNVTFYNHLSADELNILINSADIVISRSGYSSVMDLIPLGKRCIFIPTPGQTEQIYLAEYLSAEGYCIARSQHKFSLQETLSEMKIKKLTPFVNHGKENYKTVLKDLLH